MRSRPEIQWLLNLDKKLQYRMIANFFLIAGPCVIESEEQVLDTAKELVEITNKYNIELVSKSSFDKANRSSIDSYRGPGLDHGLEIF